MALIRWVEELGKLQAQAVCSSCWHKKPTASSVALAIARLTGTKRDALWEAAQQEVNRINNSQKAENCPGCNRTMIQGEINAGSDTK